MAEVLPWAQGVVSTIIVAALAYHALALYEVTRFARRRARPDTLFFPPVTLLKPLVRWEGQSRDNLASFCRQHYPAYQVLVGLPGHHGANPLAAELATAPSDVAVQWVACNRHLATNPKINELLQLYPLAQHDILILSDADMRVDPEYIAQIVAPFQDSTVGVVTCLYSVQETPTLPAAIEALMINVDFAPSVLVARRLFGLNFALGASIAIRRGVLEAIGGFEGLADYLADDYHIGHRAWQAGYHVVLSDYVVENRLPAMRFKELYRHQLRWARTHRICQPVGWFFSIIAHVTFWATAWLALSGFAEAGWRLVGATLIFRVLQGHYVNRRLNGLQAYWRVAWLVPLKDLFSLTLWALSFTGNRVHWAGREFLVAGDGRMQEADG